MKHQNIVFLPASDSLRQDLYKLGKDFLLVRIDDQLQFMIITNQAGLAQDLSMKYDISSFYISDSKRSVFRISREGNKHFSIFHPNKLGRLQRLAEKPADGKSFLVVTEDNATYHYCIAELS